jgi:hypothetical protein
MGSRVPLPITRKCSGETSYTLQEEAAIAAAWRRLSAVYCGRCQGWHLRNSPARCDGSKKS